MAAATFPRRLPTATTSGCRRLCGLAVAAAAVVRFANFAAAAFAGAGAASSSSSRHSAVPRGPRLRRAALPPDAHGFLPLEVFEPALRSYYDSSPPLFQEMKDFLEDKPLTSHWAHAVGGSFLFAYAAYAIYLGYQIREGKGGQVFPMSYEQPARDRHPTMMTYVLLLLAFEIPDGLSLLAADPKAPLLHSNHSSTAVVSLFLMGVVALVGFAMKGSKDARSVHTYLGTATVLVLGAHTVFGIDLGWNL
eukprot:TRINITY_DN14955_c0_g1_i1.p1 TRINITY_DN14955_c0_g1~~TRINITY_DN14955_c0_g1_i1.p1  ORF type:complete len:249 (+),score=48.52 TRINITY_DN14955_c0_g1_i1:80-826(+)